MDVEKELSKRGYSKLCYGDVYLMDNLGGNRLADYDPSTDIMRIGFKMLKKSNANNQKIAFIHELGHRNYHKFLTSAQRSESDSKFIEASYVLDKSRPKTGDIVIEKGTGDKFRVEDFKYVRSLQYIVKLIELGESSQFKTKDLEHKYKVPDKSMMGGFVIENNIKNSDNTYFPRIYGTKNKYEFYAVLWECWFQNILKDPAKTWFENLNK